MGTFELETKVIMGIDLAAKNKNPTGIAVLKCKKVKTFLLYTDSQLIETITLNNPYIIAIDAPFSLPKKGIFRKADKEMIKQGYRVFPPRLPSMKKLTQRAVRLNRILSESGFKTIEVHPTSTCKALSIPIKDKEKVQTVLTQIGLKGDFKVRPLTLHEIDAILAALTAYLHVINQTDALGDNKEGYIIVPKRQDWRAFKI